MDTESQKTTHSIDEGQFAPPVHLSLWDKIVGIAIVIWWSIFGGRK